MEAKKKRRSFLSLLINKLTLLTHTFDSQIDLALSFLWLFAWREVRSSDGDGSLRVFANPLQGFFRRHLPPGSLRRKDMK